MQRQCGFSSEWDQAKEILDSTRLCGDVAAVIAAYSGCERLAAIQTHLEARQIQQLSRGDCSALERERCSKGLQKAYLVSDCLQDLQLLLAKDAELLDAGAHDLCDPHGEVEAFVGPARRGQQREACRTSHKHPLLVLGIVCFRLWFKRHHLWGCTDKWEFSHRVESIDCGTKAPHGTSWRALIGQLASKVKAVPAVQGSQGNEGFVDVSCLLVGPNPACTRSERCLGTDFDGTSL